MRLLGGSKNDDDGWRDGGGQSLGLDPVNPFSLLISFSFVAAVNLFFFFFSCNGNTVRRDAGVFLTDFDSGEKRNCCWAGEFVS